MIIHDKCAEFEQKIIELEKTIEDLKDYIDKLNKINSHLVNQLMLETGLKEVEKLKETNQKLIDCVEHYSKIMSDDYGLKNNSVAYQLLKELGEL